MTRIHREPLLWFALIGAMLFALNEWQGEESADAAPGAIVITEGRIQNLLAVFEKTWRRPPTPEEMRSLVRDFVIEEALYREGMRLGLDRDDAVIRRRVRQKMEFMLEDLLDLADPTERELGEWLASHAEDYARPASYTFRHIYFSPERRGDSVGRDVEAALAQLAAHPNRADWHELGDTLLLEFAFSEMPEDRIASQFGEEFAAGIAELELGAWGGPVRSSYGVHLVRVDGRVDGELPPLADVRDFVERDWRFAQRRAAQKDFEAKLIERYTVTIEGLSEPEQDGVLR